jgi:hypothetical protein
MSPDQSWIPIVYAAAFAIALVLALTITWSSSLNRTQKGVLAVALVAIGGLSYYLGGRSGLSPFTVSGSLWFGSDKPESGNISLTLTGIAGAIAGTVGSYFFRADAKTIDYRGILKPLAFCPITMIPVIKMIESANDKTFLGHALLFCIAYQTGFFWERLLKSNETQQ